MIDMIDVMVDEEVKNDDMIDVMIDEEVKNDD
jgi:hypothetical protein